MRTLGPEFNSDVLNKFLWTQLEEAKPLPATVGRKSVSSHFRALPLPQIVQLYQGVHTGSVSLRLYISAAIAPYDHTMSLLGYQCPCWCLILQPRGRPVKLCALNQRSFHGGWLCGSSISSGEIQGSSSRLPNLSAQTIQLPSNHSFQGFAITEGLV